MRNTVVDLLLVRIGLGIAFANALRNDALVAFRMTGVLAIFTLHACRVLEEIPTECTAHDVVKLVLYELVAVHLVNLLLALTDSSLSSKTQVNLSSDLVGLFEAHLKLDLPSRLQIKPAFDRARVDLGLGTRHSICTALLGRLA